MNQETSNGEAGRLLPAAHLLGPAAYERLITDIRAQKKLAAQSGIKPEWIRLPAPRERCPWTQFSRSGMCDVVVNPALEGKIPVKVIKAIREGKSRGAVMIHFDSLMAYLNSLASGPNQ